MAGTGLLAALEVVGLIDRDYRPEGFLASLSSHVHPLDLHEVESLLCLPSVVSAVCAHLSRPFDEISYLESLRSTVDETQRKAIVIERWKARIEPLLGSLVSGVKGRNSSIDELIGELPGLFDQGRWTFDPRELLEEEVAAVQAALGSDDALEFLRICPGKQLVAVAAREAALTKDGYINLVLEALRSGTEQLKRLSEELVAALEPRLPPRHSAARSISTPADAR